MTLTAQELLRIREYLKVAAAHMRQLSDRGPRMSIMYADRLMTYADDADDLRRKLTPSKG